VSGERARLVATTIELGVAGLLLVLLADRAGTHGLGLGIALVCIGWLIHDDAHPPHRRDLTP
jgi:hypothetical protein